MILKNSKDERWENWGYLKIRISERYLQNEIWETFSTSNKRKNRMSHGPRWPCKPCSRGYRVGGKWTPESFCLTNNSLLWSASILMIPKLGALTLFFIGDIKWRVSWWWGTYTAAKWVTLLLWLMFSPLELFIWEYATIFQHKHLEFGFLSLNFICYHFWNIQPEPGLFMFSVYFPHTLVNMEFTETAWLIFIK